MDHSRPLFSLVSSFQQLTEKLIVYKILLITEFELETSGIGSNRSPTES